MSAEFSLPVDTSLGKVTLTIADLSRSLAFYRDTLGFTVNSIQPGRAELGAGGNTFLILVEQPGIAPRPSRTTGLFHFAILVPTREDLARSLRRLAEHGYPLSGASDHLVSQALYLTDPDGLGIEIYHDRPREEWTWVGDQVRMASDPLDLDELLNLVPDSGDGLAPGTRIGHVHLHVADLQKARDFYEGLLGFDLVSRYPGALFLSAGRYHHHIAVNTWAGSAPPPEGVAGLKSFEVLIPASDFEGVRGRLAERGVQSEAGLLFRDPVDNVVLLQVA